MITRVFLGLGSNIENRENHLEMALNALCGESKIRFIQVSPFYKTSPWGLKDQPCFLNQVLEIETRFRPLELLQLIKRIEKKAKRQPGVQWGPRTLDIDILLYEMIRYADENLRIPHPHLHERRFVLEPLAKIAPNLWIPGHEATAAELLTKCMDPGQVTVYQSKKSHDS